MVDIRSAAVSGETHVSKKFRSITLLALGIPSLALVFGCTSGNNGFTNNEDCDYVMAVGIATGTQAIITDRQCPSFLSLDMEATVDFRDQGGPAANPNSQFYLAYYDVTYRNNRTGGTTPYVDVPPPIRVPLATVVDPGDTAKFTGWPILEPGQKLNAPLNDSAFYPPGGVPMTATLTWWGWPLTNPEAACFQTMSWEITIYTTGPLPTDPALLLAFQTSCD